MDFRWFPVPAVLRAKAVVAFRFFAPAALLVHRFFFSIVLDGTVEFVIFHLRFLKRFAP